MIKTKDHARVLELSQSREKGIPNSRHKTNCLLCIVVKVVGVAARTYMKI
jgi:hypothetical protein